MDKYKAKTHEPDSMDSVQSNIATALFSIANAIEKQTEVIDRRMDELTDGTSDLFHLGYIDERLDVLIGKLEILTKIIGHK